MPTMAISIRTSASSRYPCRTNTVSNTAFRGFGGPQGMVAGERMLDEVAFATGLDPLEVRKRNLYGKGERNVTPYHQAGRRQHPARS